MHRGFWIFWTTLAASLVLAACSTTPTPQPPTLTPTPIPPDEAILLEITDTSQVTIIPPVQAKLLVKACREQDSYRRDERVLIPCAIGILDANNSQWIQLHYFEDVDHRPALSLCQEIEWSPDGTRFICQQGFLHAASYSFNVFRADGKELFDGHYSASWSPDGRYLVATTCIGPNIEPAYTSTVFDANTWEKTCAITRGSPMMCPHGTDRECSLPLLDGRLWVIKESSKCYLGLALLVCEGKEDCSPENTGEKVQETSRTGAVSERYQALIENYWLRITDIETGAERIYVIPGYQIKTIAWSPD
jgi:hypothetical protein